MLILSIFLGVAQADENDDQDTLIIYKEKTEIDFEGMELEGQLVKPQGALLQERSRAGFNPLIRLRTDFNLEMSNSINDVK